MEIQVRVTRKEAQNGCIKEVQAGGMRISVRIPAGVTEGRELNLRAVPFPTGAQDVRIRIHIAGGHGRAVGCLVIVGLLGILGNAVFRFVQEVSGVARTTSAQTAAQVQVQQDADQSLVAAMEKLYQMPAQEDTAAAQVEAELLRRGSWESAGIKGTRGSGVTITAPDMVAMMNDIEAKITQGQLSVSTSEMVCEEILRRLQQGEYTLKKTSVMVKYEGEGREATVVQTKLLADAVYGGLLKWQESRLALWKEENQ